MLLARNCLFPSQAPLLTALPEYHPMVAVITPGVVAQHNQVVTYLTCGLSELLLLLPASPAIQPRRA